ncbi:MAG: hypothetical protein R8K54_04140 [Mariprofundaceae bacterium]
MNRAIFIAAILIVVTVFAACSAEESVEEEVSHVTNEGPYGGYSIQWYKTHWKIETDEQRKWCRMQEKDVTQVQSCMNADVGWAQGRADPETNPPRRWEDGSKLD